MKKLTDDTFESEVIGSNMPVLVDFHADWCGPCKMLSPTVEKIEKEYEGKVKVCGANIDEMPITSTCFRIMSVPTLILFENGEIKNKSVGVVSYGEIESMIEKMT